MVHRATFHHNITPNDGDSRNGSGSGPNHNAAQASRVLNGKVLARIHLVLLFNAMPQNQLFQAIHVL